LIKITFWQTAATKSLVLHFSLAVVALQGSISHPVLHILPWRVARTAIKRHITANMHVRRDGAKQ